MSARWASPAAVSKIRVCLLSDTVGMDAGTERQVVETAKRLDKHRFDVHVCCLQPSPQLTSLEAHCKTAVFPAESLNSFAGLREIVRFSTYLRRNHIQIAHAYMNTTGMLAVMASLGSPNQVVTSRLNTGYWYTPRWKAVFRVMNLATNRVMANSEEAKRIAIGAEGLNPDKISVVYQGVDMSIFNDSAGDASACRKLGIPDGCPVVGIVANLRPVKDIPLFLEAANIVGQTVGQARFVVVGGGELLPELQQLVCELRLQEKVFFTRGTGEVIDYLRRMSVGCLTSKSEGFSNAILEYMAAGLPVVATDVGGNREAIVDGETGFLVSARTPEAIAEPIVRLLQDAELRVSMGKRGNERCRLKFEIHRTIGDLEHFYEQLAGRGESAS